METVARDRIVSRLRELGLSTHEALAYATLLSHPSMTASTLCKETGIPDSKIYYALDGLSRKGMLIIQKGTPNIYLPTPPKDAVVNLKEQLTEELNEKTKEADVLADLLTPIYESVEKSDELEIAYIIRGQRNIINRMKALIETARKEITIFISYTGVFKELKDSLITAKEKRKVNLNIAVTQEVYEKEDFSDLGQIRLLCCLQDIGSIDTLGMLITDVKTLLTVTNWADETAILTQDQNLIRVSRNYFDNPTCCRTVPCTQ
ncbi:MAG TPA: helix-turn-helix domain-containing protein [Candidatus Bathyarchaeia archaeon]|nr:helix-turn-helix domain-containing protein [Candidatus Bathyarchaeia archaeon]